MACLHFCMILDILHLSFLNIKSKNDGFGMFMSLYGIFKVQNLTRGLAFTLRGRRYNILYCSCYLYIRKNRSFDILLSSKGLFKGKILTMGGVLKISYWIFILSSIICVNAGDHSNNLEMEGKLWDRQKFQINQLVLGGLRNNWQYIITRQNIYNPMRSIFQL